MTDSSGNPSDGDEDVDGDDGKKVKSKKKGKKAWARKKRRYFNEGSEDSDEYDGEGRCEFDSTSSSDAESDSNEDSDEEDNEEDEEEDGSEYDQGPKLDNKSAKKNKKGKNSKKGGMEPLKENYDSSIFNLIFKVYILEIIQMIICLFQALWLTLMERARHPLSRRPSRAQNLCREYIAFDSTFNDICFTIYQSRS